MYTLQRTSAEDKGSSRQMTPTGHLLMQILKLQRITTLSKQSSKKKKQEKKTALRKIKPKGTTF